MTTTWIVVANASRGRLYENAGIGKGLTLLSEFEHPESRMKNGDLVSDRPGYMQSVGNGHGSRQPATEPKQHEAEQFAHEIARVLESGRNQNKYERLILVASPSFLGLLKSKLPDQVRGTVSDTIEKDYTQVTEKELAKHLEHCIYL